ncbi:hypothetical protein TNCV_296271 [Trichonephila clavipes]|nr:hypothetical protein TNCV_296271 [Trichonephila clavipes]
MTNTSHYEQVGVEPQLRLNSDLICCKVRKIGQPCVESFMNVLFMQGDQPFASRSHHATGRYVCSGHVVMSTGSVMNEELLSLQMSAGLVSKVIKGVFLVGENPKFVFDHDIFVKDMHTD